MMRRLSARVLRLLHAGRQLTRRWFTPLGRLLLWGLLMAAILAPNPAIDALAYLTLFAALLLIGLAGTRLQHGRLAAERRLPRYCTVGEPLRYSVGVTNMGRRTVTGITVVDELGRRYPTAFHGYRGWRRHRLLQRGGSIDPAGQGMQLAPGGTGDIELQLVAHRRGWLRFDRLHLLLPDPLGLCNRCVTLGMPGAVLSLPRRYPVRPVGGTGGSGRRRPLPRAGPSPDFLYLRDYRHGDPMQRIYWQGYARHGLLLVREYEHPDTPRLGLLLDTCTSGEAQPSFEAAVSVAASLLTPSTRHDGYSIPSVLVIGSQVRMHVPQLPNTAGTWQMLEHVACATTEPEANLPRFTAAARNTAAQLGIETLVAVFPGWDEPRRALCATLRQAGHKVLALVTGQAGQDTARNTSAPPGGPVYLDINDLEQALDRPLCAA